MGRFHDIMDEILEIDSFDFNGYQAFRQDSYMNLLLIFSISSIKMVEGNIKDVFGRQRGTQGKTRREKTRQESGDLSGLKKSEQPQL